MHPRDTPSPARPLTIPLRPVVRHATHLTALRRIAAALGLSVRVAFVDPAA